MVNNSEAQHKGNLVFDNSAGFTLFGQRKEHEQCAQSAWHRSASRLKLKRGLSRADEWQNEERAAESSFLGS